MSASSDKETPLMKQYGAIKSKYPGALLLFRVGDFYETFGEDAVKTSKILGIILTKRANGAASEMELAGFPHHSLDHYLPKLVRAGERVAICDQLEDPKMVKGIVKRGVTELVTPGLSYLDPLLDQKKNHYLAAVAFGAEKHGISFLDLTTGEFSAGRGSMEFIMKMISGYQPGEVIFSKKYQLLYQEHFYDRYHSFRLEDWIFQPSFGYDLLKKQFSIHNLKGFGLDEAPEAVSAAGAILHYLDNTEHKHCEHISGIARIDDEPYVWIDRFTLRNLELLESAHPDGKALIDVLDETLTPMGGRTLRKWLALPLKDIAKIKERLDSVEWLLQETEKSSIIIQHLSQIGDLERLIAKVAVGRINPREMVQLSRSLSQTTPIRSLLLTSSVEAMVTLGHSMISCQILIDKINQTLQDNAPQLLNQGNYIKSGVHEELDHLRTLSFNGKDYLAQLQRKESDRTGIPSLKIAFNKVFGYYLEVTHVHKDKVPQDWIRKQTLVNAERYITPELKEYEEKILTAEEKIATLEWTLYQELIHYCTQFIQSVQQNARSIAVLDVLVSFASVSAKYNYTKPTLTDESVIDIKQGRHPVIERYLPTGESFIANDVYLNDQTHQILIITGPNMSGKSAILRQTALVTVMAQSGCFVSAGHARMGITDKIFTRVGASDNLSKGESTFMVEMTETALIMNNLSDRSLILMDEIGRGTSTYDGISIAWAIVEYLHKHPKYRPKTLFATHYHELNQLSEQFSRIQNFHVSVQEIQNKVVFLRKLIAGGTEHSFGIHVAQMAGMPNTVVIRANEILHHLEKEKVQEKKSLHIPKYVEQQLHLFDTDPVLKQLMQMLSAIDINTLSPVEALIKLNEMKTLLKGNN